jgi:abhydrolase domain-containing protein 6
VPLSREAFSTSFDNSTVTLDSGRVLSLRQEGTLDPPVVLLHGLNSHSGTWRKNIPVLAQKRRVLAPSLPPWRGPTESVEIREYVALVEELIQKEIHFSKVSLVGNSLGGWIAMKIAQLHPEQMEAIILEDSAGIGEDENMLQALDASRIPVCIIWGASDRIATVDAARYLHSRLSNSELLLFENTGHVPHWEKHEEFNDAVASFLGLQR